MYKNNFINKIVIVLLLLPGLSIAASSWTEKVKVERVGVTPGAGGAYLVVSGDDTFSNYCTSGSTKYLRLDITTEPSKLVYSTALTLYATGKQARIYVDNEDSGKCSIIVLQSCDLSGSNCAVF